LDLAPPEDHIKGAAQTWKGISTAGHSHRRTSGGKAVPNDSELLAELIRIEQFQLPLFTVRSFLCLFVSRYLWLFLAYAPEFKSFFVEALQHNLKRRSLKVLSAHKLAHFHIVINCVRDYHVITRR
jgi:hypothetical protein